MTRESRSSSLFSWETSLWFTLKRPDQRQAHLCRILFPERHAGVKDALRLRNGIPDNCDFLLCWRAQRRIQVCGVQGRHPHEQYNLQETNYGILSRNLQRHIPARIYHGSPGNAHLRPQETNRPKRSPTRQDFAARPLLRPSRPIQTRKNQVGLMALL